MRIRLAENLLYLAMRLCKALDRRQMDYPDVQPGKVKNILLVSSTALGDALLSTPAIRSIRLGHPNARISLLLNAAYRELFAGHPDIDEIILYYGGWRRFFRLARSLRQRHFDIACIFHGNEPQATPLAYLSGARFIFKLPNTSRFRFLLTNREPVLTWDDFGHGIEQRLKVAELAGGALTDFHMTLPVKAAAEQEAAAILKAHGIDDGTPLLGLQPGASTTSRRWAPAHFVELARQLLAAHPELRIVVTGSAQEKPLCREIAAAIGDKRAWASAGEVPLRLLPALLKRCFTLVTGDTGPMHLAVAVEIPVVALFAVSDARRSGPAYDLERHTVIQKPRTCDPCLSKRCPYPLPICMENITLDEVRTAVERQFSAYTGARHGD
jgi:lipopolysaccharide heptosyltransferase II